MTTAAAPASPSRDPLYRGYRFPAAIISHAVWLYYRFALRHRDVEELLAERGVQVSYEAIRLWCQKFGPAFAAGGGWPPGRRWRQNYLRHRGAPPGAPSKCTLQDRRPAAPLRPGPLPRPRGRRPRPLGGLG